MKDITFEEYVDGTIGHGINREVEVKAIVKKHKDLLTQLITEASKGFKRDEVFEKYGIDIHNTKQYRAFMDGWNEAHQVFFTLLKNKRDESDKKE